jgi:hypothetical protein
MNSQLMKYGFKEEGKLIRSKSSLLMCFLKEWYAVLLIYIINKYILSSLDKPKWQKRQRI